MKNEQFTHDDQWRVSALNQLQMLADLTEKGSFEDFAKAADTFSFYWQNKREMLAALNSKSG